MYLQHFLSYLLLQRDASSETLKAYEHDIRLYLGFLDEHNIRLTKVRPKHFSEYLEFLRQLPGKKPGERASRSTLSRRIAAVSSFHQWLVLFTNGKIVSPVLKLHRVKKPKGRPKPISHHSSAALTCVPKLRDRVIFKLFLASGLRLSELHQLNADSIRLERYQALGGQLEIGLGEVIGKGGKERVFLVDGSTYDEMAEYLDIRKASGNTPLFVSNRRTRIARRTIQAVLAKWCQRLELPPHYVHQLRHTALTRLGELGMPLLQLRDLAGHESADTTLNYVATTKKKVIREYFAAMERANDQPEALPLAASVKSSAPSNGVIKQHIAN